MKNWVGKTVLNRSCPGDTSYSSTLLYDDAMHSVSDLTNFLMKVLERKKSTF